MQEAGIYIHIPFCMRRCNYCDFISFQNKENLIEDYIQKLQKEIILKQKEFINYEISTIYIGGGTPSFIDSKYIVDILKLLPTKTAKEVTIEINPGTITENKVIDYKNAGINRVSIGLQTTNNKLLNLIGRIHTYEKFLDGYNLIKKFFENINIDLMIGLPTQTTDDVKKDLKKVVTLNPTHISVYSLIVEEKTVIDEQIRMGKIILPSDAEERKMYWTVKEYLEKENFIQYEISNFSKPNFESKHNLNCWQQKEYFGIGLAAHSYINNVRYSNTEDLNEYIYKPLKKIIHEKQMTCDKEKEYMILNLRLINGVNISNFKNKFKENPIFLYRKELNKLVNLELLEIDENNIKLTKKGLDLANIVWEEFI